MNIYSNHKPVSRNASLYFRALADMNNDGKMDMHEFSIAMKLIKLKLQGHPLPPSLPPSMKQPPLSLPPPAPFGNSMLKR